MRGAAIAILLTASAASAQVIQTSAVVPADPFAKLTAHDRALYHSGKRAMDFLLRNHTLEGRFIAGHDPLRGLELAGDDFVSQARAAYALALAAEYYRNPEAIAASKQTLLKLLDSSEAKKSPHPSPADRAAANGILLAAIYAVPAPQTDLLDKADQLAMVLGSLRNAQGVLALADEFIPSASGLALRGLMLSHARKPAPWKFDLVNKSRPFYLAWWRERKNVAMVVDHSAAYAEAFAVSKDLAFAHAVYEMNDWICSLQIDDAADLGASAWGAGGFASVVAGKRTASAPDIGSALCAECLLHACRTAREAGDLSRYRRYRSALERSLKFLRTLQVTESKAGHFAPAYQARILGGYHNALADGAIRLENMQHALPALTGYLRESAKD